MQNEGRSCSSAALVLCLPAMLMCFASARAAELRPFTVADSIGLTHFAGLETEYIGDVQPEDRILHSPDGRRFAVLTRTGRLQENINEFVLWLYEMADVARLLSGAEPSAFQLATEAARFQSASNVEAIRQVRWSDDSRSLFLVAEGRSGIAQLYRYDIEDGRLRQLTQQPCGVIAYAANNKATVFSASLPPGPLAAERLLSAESFVVPHDMASHEILNPRANEQWYLVHRAGTFVQQAGTDEPLRVPEELEDLAAFWLQYWLSPDGRYAITLRQPVRIPETWEQYEVHPQYPHYRMKATAPGEKPGGFAWQYALIDMRSGAIAPLFDAPAGILYFSGVPLDVVWSPDGGTAILGNTYLPLEGVDAATRARRKSGPAIAAFDVREKSVSVIDFVAPATADNPRSSVSAIAWDERSRDVRIMYGRTAAESKPSCYRLDKSKKSAWVPAACASFVFQSDRSVRTPVIEIEEDLNTSPKLFARDSSTGRKALLADPNPQLATMSLGPVEKIQWKDRTGHEWRGALVKPPDYTPGRRYPLVLQTHGDSEHLKQFLVDGPGAVLFAAQALANRGIVVLQVIDSRPKAGIPEEAAHNMRGYESAIDTLDRQGLIDRERVGLIGWSRTTWFLEYTLTHSDYPWKAAAAAEGIDQGYWQFLMYVGDGPLAENHSEPLAANGGYPFGPSLANWMKTSAGFNAERVRTPLLIDVYNPFSAYAQWEIYAALKSLGKPVEMSVLRDGAHSRVKPRHRMVSQGGSVDWFDFWLNGREDAQSSKAEQYQRWRRLRELRDAQQANKDNRRRNASGQLWWKYY